MCNPRRLPAQPPSTARLAAALQQACLKPCQPCSALRSKLQNVPQQPAPLGQIVRSKQQTAATYLLLHAVKPCRATTLQSKLSVAATCLLHSVQAVGVDAQHVDVGWEPVWVPPLQPAAAAGHAGNAL